MIYNLETSGLVMPATHPQTRRTISQRAKRLLTHPIRTIRESVANRQNREREIYFAAAQKTGQSERNAREFANQISGKAMMRSTIGKLVRPGLEPHARAIRYRQDLKEQAVLLRRRLTIIEDKLDSGAGSVKQEMKWRERIGKYRAQLAQIEQKLEASRPSYK